MLNLNEVLKIGLMIPAVDDGLFLTADLTFFFVISNVLSWIFTMAVYEISMVF